MELNKFIALRPYLYHLTDISNIESILSDYTLKSTSILSGIAKLEDRDTFLRTRRVGHKKIGTDIQFSIRDQDPLYEKIVNKNLANGMTFGDFVYLLNTKVFFWAKDTDLQIHYGRYEKQNEFPVILRVSTADLFKLNKVEPEFCRLNSGAPRCSSYYKEGAPPRGRDTFQKAKNYSRGASTVREVTFENSCSLPKNIFISKHPNQPFKSI